LIEVERSVVEQFPGITVLLRLIEGVAVKEGSAELEELKARVVEEVRSRFTAEALKDHPVFRAYRDFFWRLGVDPTKTRPAGEALVRRTLVGKPVPRINTAVDAYNLASMKTGVALAAFDLSKLTLPLKLRFAEPPQNCVMYFTASSSASSRELSSNPGTPHTSRAMSWVSSVTFDSSESL